METQALNLTDRIKFLEEEIREKRKQIVELKNKIPNRELEDYTFLDGTGDEIKLSDLFNGKNELMIIHNMGKGCRYCTLWADEYNGIINHLESRLPFFVISPDPPAIMNEFAESRNWKFRILSSAGTTFKKDIGFENAQGKPMPGVSVLVKRENGKIVETVNDKFGPGDFYSSIWHYFELLPDGANDWEPKYSY